MKSKTTLVYLCFLIFGLTLSACGQKGPIENERPQLFQEDTLDNLLEEDVEEQDLQEEILEEQPEALPEESE